MPSSETLQEKERERETRLRLGIPQQAATVAVFGMTSHWDINWLKTSRRYYQDSVEKIITKALSLLDADSSYRYAISEMDFLKTYWDDHPEARSRITEHLASGRLRIVGGGITSPDTLLPPGELLVRDWLMGNRWASTVSPHKPVAAWQPDSFGHSPSLPAILRAMGYRYVAFARTDGSSARMPRPYPSPPTPEGTSAKVLEDAKTSDFYWISDDGSEVLAHWMHQGYFVADGLDMVLPELSPVLAFLGVDPEASPFWSPDVEIALDRMAGYIDRMNQLRSTPYMFIPVGSDFGFPVSRLADYVAQWNRTRYETTGVYCVVAPFEDYIQMVGGHRESLPVLPLDMSPYWMGFYTSKPELKRLQRHTMEVLLEAEKLSCLATYLGYGWPETKFYDAWYRAVRCNHHDGIPGTSTDFVYRHEQLQEMREAETQAEGLAEAALSHIAARVKTTEGPQGKALLVFNPLSWQRSDWVEASIPIETPGTLSVRVLEHDGAELPAQVLEHTIRSDGSLTEVRIGFVARNVPPLGFKTFFLKEDPSPYPSYPTSLNLQRKDHKVVLENDYYRMVIDLRKGAGLTSLVETSTGAELLEGPSNDVVVWKDTGGLYRLGNEIHEGGLKEIFHTTDRPVARFEVLEHGPVRIRIRAETAWIYPIRQELLLTQGSPRIEGRLTLRAPIETAFTLRFWTTARDGLLTMSIPYGEVTRAEQKLYIPTFWPGIEWVSLQKNSSEPSFDMTTIGSRGWRFSRQGLLECMLHRNALIELPDILGPPGTDPDLHTIVYGLYPSSEGSWLDRCSWQQAREMNAPLRAVLTGTHDGVLRSSFSIASVDDPRAEIVAIKPSEDKGTKGLYVRIFRYGQEPITTGCTFNMPGRWEAWLTYASETERGTYLGTSPTFDIALKQRITTLLMVPDQTDLFSTF